MNALDWAETAEHPWSGNSHTNPEYDVVAIDESSADLPPDGPAEILYQGVRDEGWDGFTACVVRLDESRFAAWESWWGPTGSGFHPDAYGGDVIVYVGSDLAALVATALTDAGRELVGIPREGLR